MIQAHHVCIQTDCYASSLRFYTDVLGMELVQETPDFHGRDYNTWLRTGTFFIELQTPKDGGTFDPPDTRRAGLTHLCFYTDDLDGTYRTLCARGVENFLLHDGTAVYEVNGGRLFKLTAPEGTILEFRDHPGC
jgi:glyoxylase I family protein